MLDAVELNNISDPTSIAETRSGYGSESETRDLRGYRQLKVWQVSMDLVAESYRLSSTFPSSEMFGLTRQLRRAAVSINLNIAEGWGRNRKIEFARFAEIARASANETESAFEIALRLGYLEKEQLEEFFKLLDKVCSMLYRLIEALRKEPT